MADLSSRPMFRNSSILSKKLSSVSHTSFRGGKSVYDDVFGSSSSSSPSSKKLKATFSARMEDYCEMFNCSSSSIPFLDLPDVDAVVTVPSSGSDYAAIFGDSLEEAWIESGTTSPSDEDEHAFGLEEIGLPSEDNEMYETVDGKKQFKMSYHQTSINRSDGMSGTTHIAQLHAVSGFTRVIDEVPPLQKSNSIKPKPVFSIGDLSSDRDIQEGVKEEKYREKDSSNLPKSVQSKSFSSGVSSNAHKEAILEHETHERDDSSSRPNIQEVLSEEIYRENVSLNLPKSGIKDDVQSKSLLNGVQFNAHKEAISEHDDSSSLPDIQEGLKEENYIEKVSSDLPNSGFKEDGRSRSESFSNVLQFSAHNEPISKHETRERDGSSSRLDIQEGSMEDRLLKTPSSNLSNSASKEFGSSSSFPNSMQFNAFSFGSNTHHASEFSSNYGDHETDEFLNAMDDTPTFSDEEVDMNSTAAASAAAVRKAIELAQESIQHAKEVMDQHKGMWNSETHSSRSDVKVKEFREIKIAGEGKKLKEEKRHTLEEPKDDTIGIFSGTNKESTRNTTYIPFHGVIKETDGKHSILEPLFSEYEQGGDKAEEATDSPNDTVKSETNFKAFFISEEDIKKDTPLTDDESDEIWESAMDTFESSDSDSECLKVDEEAFVPTQFGLNINAVNVGQQELERDAFESSDSGSESLKVDEEAFVPAQFGLNINAVNVGQQELERDAFESSDSGSESLKVDEEAFVPAQFGLNINAVNVGQQELERDAFESSDSGSESLKVVEEAFVPAKFGLNINAVNVGQQEMERDAFESSDSGGESLKVVEEAFVPAQFGLNINAVNVGQQELKRDAFESSDSGSESLKVVEEAFVPAKFGLNINAVNVGQQELERDAFESSDSGGESLKVVEEAFVPAQFGLNINAVNVGQQELERDTFESSDSDSESLKVDEEANVPTQFGLDINAVNVGEQKLENSSNKIELGENVPDIEGTENKLEDIEKHVESEQLNDTDEQEGLVEARIDLQEPIEHTNEYTTKPLEDYEYKEEAIESQKQLESDIDLNESHSEDIEVLEDSDGEVYEIKLEGVTVIVEKMHMGIVEEGHECSEDEKQVLHGPEVQELSVGVHAEKNETEDQEEDQELEFDDCDNGKGYVIRNEAWKPDGELESEGYVIRNEAWKPEELDNILQEVGWGRERTKEHRYNYQMEEEEADEAEDCGLKHRRPYQKQEQESNINTSQESLTHPEKVHYVIQGEVENPREPRIEEDSIANTEGVRHVFTQEEIRRIDRDIKSSSELEESEEETDAVEIEHENKEAYAGCVGGDVVDHHDHQIENNIQDVSTSFSTEVEEINRSEVNEEELKTEGLAKDIEPKEMFTTTSSYEEEYELEVEDLVIELEEKVKLETARLSEDEVMHVPASLSEEEVTHETASLSEEEVMHETASLSGEEEVLVETASSSEEEQEHNDAVNSLKDEGAAFFIEESVLNLGVANINSRHEHIHQNTEERLDCGAGEDPTDKFEQSKKKEEAAVPASGQVKELNEIKAANADEDKVENVNKMDADGLNSLHKGKENTAEAAHDTRTGRYTEAVEKLDRTSIAEEKEPNTNRDEAKEKDRERVAVERAIREARERAFADVRERAEKAAMEKSIEEARQRIKMSVRERLDKEAEAKVSMEVKRKSERAAVERATEEARKRALQKAMSEKATIGAKGNHQGAGSSNVVSEIFDDGTKPESSERCKAKLEKNQRIVERAAKALEEKNRRDRLAQREQAERNRYAETLDADVKRWSNGKTGNLRALLSTLQYILGPDGGWQPVHLNDIVSNSDVKKAYRRATLLVHPDKLQQRGASIQQKYICEKVFDLLKEAWNRFSSEDR